ncbi:MAG: hypothetical protein WAM95_06065 [Bacillus sp. (in: firmicutes)]
MGEMKLVYKKSLMVELVKLGHDLEYSSSNRNNPKYQVWFFPWSEQIERDIVMLNGQEYVENYHEE